MTSDSSPMSPPDNVSEDADARKPARPGDLFPSRLLGFGVFTAWSSLAIVLEVDLDVARLSSPIGRLFLMAILGVALYVAIATSVRRTGVSPLGRRAFLACAAASVLFPLLETIASLTGQFAFDVAAITCYTIATVGLFLMWNGQISSHGPRTALIAYSGSFALSACIYFLVSALGGIAFVLSLALLPLLSCFLLHLSTRLEKPASAEGGEGIRWRIPWKPIVLVVVFTWAFGTVSHFDGNALMPSELGRLIAGGVVLLAAVVCFSRLDENLIAKFATLLAGAALLLCGLLGPDQDWGASKLLASTGYYSFMLFILFTLSHICYSYHVRVEWLFGIVQAAYITVSAPSGLFGNSLREAALGGAGEASNMVMSALALLLLGVCLFLLNENPFASTWGIGDARTQDARASSEGGSPSRDYLADRMYRCTMIARRFGLTHREEEVLALLADNKSFADIESTLVIAHGTLRAHVQHLYEKLDVHSKQEAIDFVNQWNG